MNKFWMILLLFFSVSMAAFATEKADFKLKWKEEPKREPVSKYAHDLSDNKYESRTRKSYMFEPIDKANRMRFSDPIFSADNSDGGSSGRIYHKP